MVHRREIDGQEIVLGNHGALWGNAMTWWDTETGSVWSQPIGEAILGPLKGQRLELLPSSLLTWAEWKEQHPDTLALDAPGVYDGFFLDDMALVVELGQSSKAFPVTELRRQPVANSEVDTVPVAVVLQPDSDKWKVFSRQLNSEVIELDLVDDELVEVGGDRRFDPDRGVSLDPGGENLDQLPAFTSFPRDYTTFFPDGIFWAITGDIPVSSLDQ